MQLFYMPALFESNADFCFDEQESRHCVQVLRHKKGDILDLTDGRGFFYKALLTEANPKKCQMRIVEQREGQALPVQIHVGIAPPKNIARFEWFLEKATEIGITEITPISTERTERGGQLRYDRLEKILVSALKQTIKAKLPVLNPMRSLVQVLHDKTLLEHYPARFIPYINPDSPLLQHAYAPAMKGQNALLLIGPEGDFTHQEVQQAQEQGFLPVSLGNSILRTETAGIVVCHTINLLNT